MESTIFAPSTAPGRAGVGVMRISGPKAHDIGRTLVGTLPPSRMSGLRILRDPIDGSDIDQALVLVFDENASFTGEQVVEFQHHGSQAVTAKLVQVLSVQPNSRLAHPGEFTKRALDNGCLDLSQVEGLADLIDAETDEQRRQALRVMEGQLSRQVEAWRSNLLRAMALIEASIDFSDEDIPVDVLPEVKVLIGDVLSSLQKQLSGAKAAQQVRSGFEVAIVGRPNVGKSSLINRLSRRDVSLISEIAGTTRDIVEARLEIGGQLVTFLDTAGIRQTDDLVEGLGVERARQRAESADIRIFLLEATQTEPDNEIGVHDGDIILQSKDDEGTRNGISSHTEFGVEKLLDDLRNILAQSTSTSSLLIRERHRQAITEARDYLLQCADKLASGYMEIELLAEDVRATISRLDQLIGRINVEDVLGEIFSSFCIGK